MLFLVINMIVSIVIKFSFAGSQQVSEGGWAWPV